LLKNSKKQIPRGLTPAADDKNKELIGAAKGGAPSKHRLKRIFSAVPEAGGHLYFRKLTAVRFALSS
jgi:hypothetical protein